MSSKGPQMSLFGYHYLYVLNKIFVVVPFIFEILQFRPHFDLVTIRASS